MPIYAYKCESCGFGKDVLQKLSDAPLSRCPSCGAEAFRKQVTAAGFQLKGSGWYVTDFRGGNTGGGKKDDEGKTSDAAPADGTAAAKEGAPAAASAGDGGSGTAAALAPAPAAASPAVTASPAPAPSTAAPPAGSSRS